MMIKLLILLALTQAADWYTTVKGLRLGAREANPIMRKAFDLLGVNSTLAAKSVFVFWIGYELAQQEQQTARVLLVLFYVGVIVNNALVLKKLK